MLLKKKEQSEPESGLIRSKDKTRIAVAENKKPDSLERQIDINDNFTKRLQQMQDSLDQMSKRNSAMTDSLTKARNVIGERIDTIAVKPQEEVATLPARMQQDRNASDSRDYERLQKQQNDLLRQYARQADMLSKDIDRLNKRIIETRRNDRRNSNFIPVPVPVNAGNARRQEVVTVPSVPDTVYIRDSIILKDSIQIIDTLNTFSPDTFVSRPVKEVAKTDTVLIREIVKAPKFDYGSLPEENVLFALGQSSLQPIYESRLDFIASVLKRNADLQVRITGHTDSTGSRAVNERLSLQRAETVVGYLINKGVAERQIKVISQSYENPAVSGNSAAARSQNRRVALKLEKLDK